MANDEEIKAGPFTNACGALVLVRCDDGQLYLEMEDCHGSSHFGPLTDEQVEAFDVLCDAEPADQ